MMKPLLLVLLTLPTIAQSQAPAPSAENENAAHARAVLNQAIQALGGQAYLNIKDMSQEGRTYAFDHGQPSSGSILFWLFWKFPDQQRIEITKQRDIIYIFTGGKGYEKTFKGTRPMEAKQEQDFERQSALSLSNMLRVWLNDPSVALFYDGSAFMNNTTADQVTLLSTKNQSVTLYLDSRTHLPVQKSFTIRDPQTSDRDKYDELYSDYHLVQGVQTALNTTRMKNGDMTSQRFLTKISYNTGLPDSLFTATVTYDPDAKRKH